MRRAVMRSRSYMIKRGLEKVVELWTEENKAWIVKVVAKKVILIFKK